MGRLALARLLRRHAFAAIVVVVAVFCFGLLSVVIPGSAAAQDADFFNSSPGPLSMSHAGFDSQDKCNDCHTGGRGLANDKCLACHDHDDLKKRIDAGKGFHASVLVKGKKCESCHLEHKGRAYDLMGWRTVQGGEKGFDHKLTGWPLEGKHAAIDCADCHKTKNKQGLRTYMGIDSSCGSCHKDDQPHGFERKEMMACERCHGQGVWKPAKSSMDFDHDKKADAGMPLLGSHEDVACAKCHPKALFNLKPAKADSCGNAGCHNSPHDGHLFGKKECETCHSPTFGTLNKQRFDHDRKTRFDLGAAHAKNTCYQCHTKKLGETKPSMDCERCHASDNKHGDRFDAFGDPPKCDTCHTTSNTRWSPNGFEHDKRTKFALTGKHEEVGCRSCHRGARPDQFERFDPKTVGCMGCHSHTNVHNKEHPDSKCLTCHLQPGEVNIRAKSVDTYHGPQSDFPLVKAHKGVKCGQCHISTGSSGKGSEQFKNTPKECGVRCHKDTLHQGTLGQECSKCHVGGEWTARNFDHNTADTEWPLRGFHKEVDCQACHPKRAYDATPKNCSAAGCHGKDDAHQGKLGTTCDRCHLETGENKFNHNTMAQFQLDGEHLGVRCADCHPSVTFKPRPKNCFGCHPEPAIHKGQYGTLCEQCHTTRGFREIKALHDVGDFALKGAHDNQPCAKCHKDSRPLQGAGNLCVNCHRQDDIHSNSLSPRCGECHTQWSFAPARFDHTTVGCNLTGLHRTLTCYDCHKAGNFGGLSPICASCHSDDAARQATPYHQNQISCASCHNPNAWLPASTTGGTQYGRDSVCR
jgi:hypothetical protein